MLSAMSFPSLTERIEREVCAGRRMEVEAAKEVSKALLESQPILVSVVLKVRCQNEELKRKRPDGELGRLPASHRLLQTKK